ncbi:unnamed protein product [Adineta steineri]|uniref:Uncharacterized protein n=1 Tax=Adineta steineri TaxID=433720 RepID=A0A816A4R1_9BILA|nr:unnamed protein product [Adineta steineri]CAF1592713.1 unnamed protein product [Adineta steineri]
MTSPVDTFKNSLFGQLKSYGDAVQGAFEQRIARPLIALKRDFARSSSSKTHTSPNRESILSSQQTSFVTHQESLLSSSPLEIIDFETNASIKPVLDKSMDSISSTEQKNLDDITINQQHKSIKGHRQSSMNSSSNKNHRQNRLCHYKSVSFAEQIQYDNDSQDSIKESNEHEFVHNDPIITTTTTDIDKTINTIDESSIVDDNENDFDQNFHHIIKPRRISIGNSKDLVYQDISAEIVAYVLKNALRIIEKEDEDFLLKENQKLLTNNQQNDDITDLK